MRNNRLVACLLGALIALITVGTASGEERLLRKRLEKTSRLNALNGRSVELMTRGKGPGRDVAMTRALKSVSRLAVDESHKLTADDDFMMAKGKGWFAEIRAHGEWVRYRNDHLIHGNNNYPLSVESRISTSELEGWGRAFIKQELGEMVALQPGERLEPWGVVYEIAEETNAAGDLKEEVYASSITFTRVIDGVAVLGSGSKVTVSFTNDGTPVGFSIDWAPLERSGRSVKTLKIEDVLARRNAQRAVTGAPNDTPEKSFTCGYLDYGSTAAVEDSVLQPVCLSAIQTAGDNNEIDAVPIGREVISDRVLKVTEMYNNKLSSLNKIQTQRRPIKAIK